MSFEDAAGYLMTFVSKTIGVLADPGHFLSILPLATALVIALLILRHRIRRRHGDDRLTMRQLFRALFPKNVFLHRSAKLDYGLFFINEGLLFFVTMSLALTPAFVATTLIGSAATGEPAAATTAIGIAERITYTIYLVLLWDFGATYAHYLKHKVPLLWEFHKVHHSAEVMTPVTALRRHPVEAVFGAGVVALVMGAGIAGWVYVLGMSVYPLNLFGTLGGIYLWRVFGYNLRHSHVWISYGNFWNRVFISPAQHQVHHSVDEKHYDTNFGHIFAFWDWLLGTLYLPTHEERVTFGIDEAEMDDYRSLSGLYFSPFIKIGRGIAARVRALRGAEPRTSETD